MQSIEPVPPGGPCPGIESAPAERLLPGSSAAVSERNQLILDELPQVYFIAARILERLPSSVQIEDLVNAGVLGLLEAFENFDSSRNAQFKTFARFRIRGAILDSLRLLDWGSRAMRRKAREISETTQRLEHTLGRKPDKEEIAAEMKVSLEQLEAAMMELDSLQIVSQYSAPAIEGGEVKDLIESAPSREENPFELCVKGEQKRQLSAAIGALSEREQMVLALYYQEELTMKEVAQVVGIALSRVSQIHNAAIVKLRAALRTGEREKTKGALPSDAQPAAAQRTSLNAATTPAGTPAAGVAPMPPGATARPMARVGLRIVASAGGLG